MTYTYWVMDIWIDVFVSPQGSNLWFSLMPFYALKLIFSFHLTYLSLICIYPSPFFDIFNGKDKKRWWRWRCFVIKGNWGGFPKILLRLGRHKDWCVTDRKAHWMEPKWFHEPSWCFFNKYPWASVKGGFMSKNERCSIKASKVACG